tara:strand:- start:6667 stop:6870 length:204 start_codon:yes stop_codon:yes gene_type:complete
MNSQEEKVRDHLRRLNVPEDCMVKFLGGDKVEEMEGTRLWKLSQMLVDGLDIESVPAMSGSERKRMA